MFRSFLVALVCTVGFTACSSSQKITKTPPEPQKIVEEYQIGVGDSLSILVWKSPEFTTTVSVRPDGKISIPLVGDLLASGESAESLAKVVTSKLSSYVRSPQVTVTVAGAGSAQYLGRVRITGAVANPVSIDHKQGLTVLDLVLQAGGLNIYAKGNKAKLFRRVEGKIEVYPVNIDDILNKGNIETNYVLAPSDILTVPERSF